MVANGLGLQAPVAVSLSEKLKEVLEQAILQGGMAAGSKINAGQLARDMGVSVIPVREALRALAADGWVTLKPNVGAHVRERSLTEARELHEARRILESEVAFLAAQRRTPQCLDRLHEIVTLGESAADRGEAAEFAEVNAAFHAAIASAAGNAVLGELHNRIALRVRFYFASAVGQRFEQSAKEHEAIAAAIGVSDAPLAARLASEHAVATQTALEEVFAGDPVNTADERDTADRYDPTQFDLPHHIRP